MNTYRHYCITREPRKSIRKDLCDGLRRLKSDNPALARLFWKRQRLAEKIMIDSLNESIFGLSSK